MVKARIDKRTQRTLNALREALLQLIVERGYEKSSVQDILDRAAVGRATFYTHFRNKEDLLKASLESLREHLMHEWKSVASGSGQTNTQLGFTLAFFRHVDSHRRIYRAIVGRESGAIVDRQLRKLLADLVKADIATPRRSRRNVVPAEMATQYIVGALMSIVTWWMDRNVKLSADQIDAAFRAMTLPAISSL